MNSTDGSKLQASGFAEFIQIWFVLEEVCVKALVVQGQVRLDIVSEFDDFYIDAFLGKLILHCIDDLFMRNGETPTLMVVVLEAEPAALEAAGFSAAAGDETSGSKSSEGNGESFAVVHSKSSL